jgi:HlyD family secretion protein
VREGDRVHSGGRASQDGMVHQFAVHTAGEVVSPGDAIMLIVPSRLSRAASEPN